MSTDLLATEERFKKKIVKEHQQSQERRTKLAEQRSQARNRLLNQLRYQADFPDWRTSWRVLNQTRLAGPTSLTYHPQVLGRQFFIFGDLHFSKEGYCPPESSLEILDFLEFMFNDISQLKDFFIEYVYQQKKTGYFPRVPRGSCRVLSDLKLTPQEEIDALGGLWHKYGPCLIASQDPCLLVYPATRFHYVDIRSRWLGVDAEMVRKKSICENLLGFFNAYKLALDYLVEYHGLKNSLMQSKNWAEAQTLLQQAESLAQLLPLDSFVSDIKNYFKADQASLNYGDVVGLMTGLNQEPEQFRTYEQFEPVGANRLRKQFQGISNPVIRRALLNYLRDEINRLYQQYQQIPPVSIWDLIRQPEIEAKWDFPHVRAYMVDELEPWMLYVEQKNSVLFGLDILVMDFYTLARIFKDALQNSQQVWIYLGDTHSSNIRRFIINYLQETKVVSANQIQERCIDIQSIRTAILEK